MGHDEGGGDESRQGGFSFQGGGDADLMEGHGRGEGPFGGIQRRLRVSHEDVEGIQRKGLSAQRQQKKKESGLPIIANLRRLRGSGGPQFLVPRGALVHDHLFGDEQGHGK